MYFYPIDVLRNDQSNDAYSHNNTKSRLKAKPTPQKKKWLEIQRTLGFLEKDKYSVQ